MIDFETWWNSSSADEFRRLNDDMDGRVVRPVWDAAIRATLSSQKATSAAPSPEATQPTQAEAPSEREAFEDSRVQAVYDLLCDETPPPKGEHWEGFAARRIVAALATQQAVQGEAVLPRPGSPEASAMIDSLLAEYQWPSNPKNAARAGFEAARRMLATPPAPGQVERDREDAK